MIRTPDCIKWLKKGIFALFFWPAATFAQTSPGRPDSAAVQLWKTGGTLTLNLNQQNSSYWVGATEDYTLSFSGAADLFAKYATERRFWDNTLKLNYGFQRNTTGGSVKNSDLIDLFSKYGITINERKTMAASLLFNGRTQFASGYDYGDPLGKRRSSGFFAPATLLLSPGMEWRPKTFFSLFFSPVSARWVIVSNRPYSYAYPGGIRPDGSTEIPLATIYGVDPAKKVNSQFGAFLSASFSKELVNNLTYTSRLDLYSNYKRKPQNMDLFWTSNLVYKLTKWLIASYQLNLAYDDEFIAPGKTGPRTQFLGTFGIGVSAKF